MSDLIRLSDNIQMLRRMRLAAHAQGWTSMDEIRQWAKETYGARLYVNKNDDWTCIRFNDPAQMTRFLLQFG